MHTLLLILLIGIASNLDNLGVGVAYGVRRIRVPFLPCLVIAAFAGLFTYLSVWAGSFISGFLSPTAANVIGAVLLIGVGIWVMVSQKRETQATVEATDSGLLQVLQEPVRADADRSGVISLPESVVLGVALSINNLTNGFSAGLWHLNALATALSSAAFSYLAIWGGAGLSGRFAAGWLGNKATIAAGCLLILLGFHQLF